MVDAAPVRAHIRWLQNAGLGIERLVSLAGISEGAVNALMYGSTAYPPSRRVHAHVAAAILEVTPTMDTLAPGAHIDATGTRRRLQALAAAGWPTATLAERLDRHPKQLRAWRTATTCTVRIHTEIERLYAVLHYHRPHPVTATEHAAVTRTTTYAHTQRWAPPSAWRATTIDDPTARPQPAPTAPALADLTVRTELGSVDMAAVARIDAGERSVRLPEHERHPAVLVLHRCGWDLARISRVTGTNPATVADLARQYCPTDIPTGPAERDRYRSRLAQRYLLDGRWVHPEAPHGKKTGYVHWGCRCVSCTAANRRPAPLAVAA